MSLIKNENIPDDRVLALQSEVAKLESELTGIYKELQAFQAKIQYRLEKEIARISRLTILYKAKKAEKKAKRLDQKKKGKNYKEPKQVKHSVTDKPKIAEISQYEQDELKRIYKQAVVHVHPDKINHEGNQEAISNYTQMTARLNHIYKSGDLEELITFYQTVVLEKGIDVSESVSVIEVDSKARLSGLKRKKTDLKKKLEDTKSSYLYQVLISYDTPDTFIDELYLHLQDKIIKLEKRTKK